MFAVNLLLVLNLKKVTSTPKDLKRCSKQHERYSHLNIDVHQCSSQNFLKRPFLLKLLGAHDKNPGELVVLHKVTKCCKVTEYKKHRATLPPSKGKEKFRRENFRPLNLLRSPDTCQH